MSEDSLIGERRSTGYVPECSLFLILTKTFYTLDYGVSGIGYSSLVLEVMFLGKNGERCTESLRPTEYPRHMSRNTYPE